MRLLQPSIVALTALSFVTLPVSAMAEPASLDHITNIHMVELLDHEPQDQVILFSISPDHQAGGEVISHDGESNCPAAWAAKLVDGSRFEDITLTLPPCADAASLQAFAARLEQVRSHSDSDEGLLLLDGTGKALLRLVIAG